MVARISTVAFQGIDVLDIDVQVQVAAGLPAFTLVGLPDKTVGESRERVRAAMNALGLALPPKRITVNLAPADVQKEGSHFDLPIAVGLLVAMGVLPADEVAAYTIVGELGLDGSIAWVTGVLPAAIAAAAAGRGLVCPAAQGGEAAWAGGIPILAAPSLLALVNHFKGTQILPLPRPEMEDLCEEYPDLRDVKGQETAKRAVEVAAAGGHNMLMIGPPGSGKSMLAARLPGLLPRLSPAEALEVTSLHSLSGQLKEGRLMRNRPFRAPHHSASVPALVGGGAKARPGEISLAHNGVLFLDELPEFQRAALEALRQPLETGKIVIARVNAHVCYPARIQLIAAMNPCRCGYLGDPALGCNKAPRCGVDYMSKISGPLFDRIDLHVDVAAVDPLDLSVPPPAEGSKEVAARVEQARQIQAERCEAIAKGRGWRCNAELDGEILEKAVVLDGAGRQLLTQAAEKMRLSARGYHRILRVARTLADMEGGGNVRKIHVAEALSYRRMALARPT